MYVGCLANQDRSETEKIRFHFNGKEISFLQDATVNLATENGNQMPQNWEFFFLIRDHRWREYTFGKKKEIVRWLRKNRPHLKVVQINLLATFHFSSSKNWIRRHNTSLPDNKRIIRLFWLLVQLHFSCNNLRPHQMRRIDTRQGPASPQKSTESKWDGELD